MTATVPETAAHRRATAGLVGGALWALLPVAWSAASLDRTEHGTLAFAAVAASYWIFAVLAPALLVVGVTALRRALGADAGRLGRVGLVLSGGGLGAMALGMGIEVASMSAGGGEVALGHSVFLLGFLVSVIGALPLGIVVCRRRRDPLSRTGGALLALALPLGLGIGMLGSLVRAGDDAWFFAAITVPTGVAWVLLGRSLTALHRTRTEELAPAA